MGTRKNGWSEYQKLVLDKLDQHAKKLESIDLGLDAVNIEVAKLEVKAGIWGFAAGIIPGLATVFGWLFLKK